MKIRRAFPVLVGFFGSPLWAGTCSLCRETLRQGGSANLIKGIYWSILLILTVPLVVLAIGLRYAWRQYS